jgi:hypothetical protein
MLRKLVVGRQLALAASRFRDPLSKLRLSHLVESDRWRFNSTCGIISNQAL